MKTHFLEYESSAKNASPTTKQKKNCMNIYLPKLSQNYFAPGTFSRNKLSKSGLKLFETFFALSVESQKAIFFLDEKPLSSPGCALLR